MSYFENINRDLQILFLDCSDEELLLRYRFTRRQHPMIVNHLATTLEDAIEVERDFLDHLQENSQNTIHIDTTKLSTSALAMYEQGERIPRDDIKMRLAKYYKRSVNFIFFDQ